VPERVGDGRDDELNVLLVVYELADLAPESEDPAQYSRLIEALRSHPVHARLTHSAWIVETASDPDQLLASLDAHLDPADRVFVAQLTGVAAWRNAACGFQWLMEHLGTQHSRPRAGLP
jgi:hypothetical protein